MGSPNTVRVVALSGGYNRADSCKMLAENDDMIASFSRAFREGLHVKQTDEEFTKTLGDSIEAICRASSSAVAQCAPPSKSDTGNARVAIAFDIDGVFKYGQEWNENGLKALSRASDAGMPFVFVTNGGGGLTEAEYGKHLKEKIVEAGKESGVMGDFALPEAKRMVLSYTPWATALAPDLKDKKVLIVGDPKEKVKEVAKSYGLEKAIHYSDYAVQNPTVNPFRAAMEADTSHTAVANKSIVHKKQDTSNLQEDPFAAVLVFCDPYHWYEAIQTSIDVLLSPTPLSLHFDANAPPMPIHFSNPDFLSKFEHPYPRFAQGAFKTALKAVYIEKLRMLRVPGETIDEKVGISFQQWGKPTAHTFRFVEQRLRELAPADKKNATVERYYMVGDNPTSDIEGCRRANIVHRNSNISWQGVLVRTGVYQDGDEKNGAVTVQDTINEAVEWILEQEGFKCSSA
jgi:HAD superfamily hydrolase (TIGR01456 family)